MTAFLVAVAGGFGPGLLIGLRWKHRRFLRERTLRIAEAAKVDAYDRGALTRDLREVGPITGPHAVTIYDQETHHG